MAKPKRPDFVIVTNRSYGSALKGAKIYFEGKKPNALKEDGRITFGKHILQIIRAKFGERARWIITTVTDSVDKEYGVVRVRTSLKLLNRMNKENWDRSRDIKNDIVQRFFSSAFPSQFTANATTTYVPNTLATLISLKMVPRLSMGDKEALNAFIPEYVASEAIGTVQKLQATAQIETLRALADNLQSEMARSHPESWWQAYIKSNILLMQQGYIKALDKLNVAIGNTKFPDFCLVTHDNYLDILEIKKPDTALLRIDAGRGNYYWDVEMSKAIIQTENYIEQVGVQSANLRSYLLDREQLDIKAVRPRGIILAGDARAFMEAKQRDDFRLLSQGIKAITVLTYDELFMRLKNYIVVLEKFADKGSDIHAEKLGRQRAKPPQSV
jgi:hypothetical protein